MQDSLPAPRAEVRSSDELGVGVLREAGQATQICDVFLEIEFAPFIHYIVNLGSQDRADVFDRISLIEPGSEQPSKCRGDFGRIVSLDLIFDGCANDVAESDALFIAYRGEWINAAVPLLLHSRSETPNV